METPPGCQPFRKPAVRYAVIIQGLFQIFLIFNDLQKIWNLLLPVKDKPYGIQCPGRFGQSQVLFDALVNLQLMDPRTMSFHKVESRLKEAIPN